MLAFDKAEGTYYFTLGSHLAANLPLFFFREGRGAANQQERKVVSEVRERFGDRLMVSDLFTGRGIERKEEIEDPRWLSWEEIKNNYIFHASDSDTRTFQVWLLHLDLALLRR